MPKLVKIIEPSLLVLESIRKIARDTSVQAHYIFLMPDPAKGTITHRSLSFVARRGQFSAAAEQFIKQNVKNNRSTKNSGQFRTKVFLGYLAAFFAYMNGKNEWRNDARDNALKIIGLLALERMKRSKWLVGSRILNDPWGSDVAGGIKTASPLSP
jgi:hypothetical protein